MNWIRLPCTNDDDLNWNSLLEGISGPIFWDFDLGLDTPYFPLEDELRFQSLKLSLSLFSEKIWPQYSEQTVGASLYKGSADFSLFFRKTDQQEENWKDWIAKRNEPPSNHLRRLFCAEAFAYYLQMLAHAIPDELPLYLFLDGTGCGSPAERLQLISQERFQHFSIAAKEVTGWDGMRWRGDELPQRSLEGTFGICFPEDAHCSSEILSRLDKIIPQFSETLRVIPEIFLTENWEGLDQIYVIADGLSPRGKRKLMGFCAAGGTVITDGMAIGLPGEISVEEFRGRGI